MASASDERQLMTQDTFRKLGLARRGVQIVVQHSPQIDQLLPEAMRQVTMLFVVPPRNTVRSFAQSIQTKLSAPTLPQITAQPAGDILPETMSVGDAHRRYSSGSARMQVSIGLDEHEV